jgi:hypothetical protein
MATGPFVGQRLTSLPCDVEVWPSPTQKVSFSTVCPLAQFGVTAPERILRCKTRRPVPGQSARSVTLEFVRASSRSSRARGRGARRLTQVSFYPSIHTLSCTCTYPLIVRAQPHPLEYLSKKGDDAARASAVADRAPPGARRRCAATRDLHVQARWASRPAAGAASRRARGARTERRARRNPRKRNENAVKLIE